MRRRPSISLLILLVLTGLNAVWSRAQAPDQNAAIVQLMHSGRDAMQRGDLAGAEEIFRRAVEAAPTLSDCYLGLGLVELRRGKLDEAAKSLGKANELNPRLPGAHLFLGIAEYQRGQNEAAIRALKAEIALAPSNTEALTWLGIVEIGAGHPEDATAPLDQAAALNQKDANILYYLGRAHALVAADAYHQLSQLDPDSALVHRALAESFAESGQPEKAIVEYQAAIARQPNNPDLYEGLGDQNQRISHVDEATKAFEKALAINENSGIALYNLGRIDVETGKLESGVALLRRAAEAHALPGPTDFYLGLGLAELGKNEEAAMWLEASLANHPSSFIEQSAYYQLVRIYPRLNKKSEAAHALEELRRLKAQAAVASSNPQPDSSKALETTLQPSPQQPRCR